MQQYVWVSGSEQSDTDESPGSVASGQSTCSPGKDNGGSPSSCSANVAREESEKSIASALSDLIKNRNRLRNGGLFRSMEKRGISGCAFDDGLKRALCSMQLPNNRTGRLQFSESVFCGQFCADGSKFVCACKADCIRVYDTSNSTCASNQATRKDANAPDAATSGAHVRRGSPPVSGDECETYGWRLQGLILPQSVGWAVVDVDVSPRMDWLAYTSWSNSISLARLDGSQNYAIELDRCSGDVMCLFSIQHTSDGREIVGGGSDACIYFADLESNTVTRIRAHADDVNSVAFVDADGQMIISGSDDSLIKVWDRRCLQTVSTDQSRPSARVSMQQKPVGVFQGHSFGITHVTSRFDGRLILSNSKDQSAKLWDLRMLRECALPDGLARRRRHFDYRWDMVDYASTPQHPNDSSLRTFRGHRVLQTLIRGYFTPPSMGSAHCVLGSHDGSIHFYDIVSGETVQILSGHRNTVRDVSLHPSEPLLATSSWDQTVSLWNYQAITS
ncbi:DDB1- and CUL4-associated factor 11 [Porphyridium purpureum]|uniref:DDB1-and CUL4-associated factor 11 n=1 Tax=Porphyridium purpureum TaxID=35688 RepID=A0A5J4Z5R2_PORPP|nr:DDB1- and CUL4-associated factor 11 [Porphyridium purpureum]|eukprot:POR4906..scf295_1